MCFLMLSPQLQKSAFFLGGGGSQLTQNIFSMWETVKTCHLPLKCDSLREMQLLYVEYMLFSIDPSDIYVDIGSITSAVLLHNNSRNVI